MEGDLIKISPKMEFLILIYFLCYNVISTFVVYIYLPNPSAQAGYDTRPIFKRSLTEFRVFLLLE